MIIVNCLEIGRNDPRSDLQRLRHFFNKPLACAGDKAIDGSALTADTLFSNSWTWSARTWTTPDLRTDSQSSSINASFSSTEASAISGIRMERLLMATCWQAIEESQ